MPETKHPELDEIAAALQEALIRAERCQKYSNSRPCECDSSWIAHFDGDRMIRHHRDVEKGLRCGLLEPEPGRFRRSSACFGS